MSPGVASAAAQRNVEPGVGSFTPPLNVQQEPAGVAVTSTLQCAGLAGGVREPGYYDDAAYTPERVEFQQPAGQQRERADPGADRSGRRGADRCLSICPAARLPSAESGVLATVHFRAEAFTAPSRRCSGSQGSANSVGDLTIIAQTATTASLR